MKQQEAKPGLFRAIAELFVRNWGLKLLSLALAILVYYTLKPSATAGKGSAVRVWEPAVENPPAPKP